MGFHGMLMQLTWVGVLLSGMAAAGVAAQLPRSNCSDRCGHVDHIPFPFGITEGCYLNKDFGLKCMSGVLTTGDLELVVTNISIQEGQLDILMYVAFQCFNVLGDVQDSNNPFLSVPSYTISNTQNEFMAVGCDTYAYLNGTLNGLPFRMGCISVCQNITSVVDGSCSGIGCCHVEIPPGLKNFNLKANSYKGHTEILSFNPCTYAFVVKKGEFNFSSDHLHNLKGIKTLPMVLDWAIGNERCNKSNFVCGGNSECYDPDNRYGYRCKCKAGYEGNPYLSDGCKDVKECQDRKVSMCTIPKRCVERKGNYACSCPKLHRGDGRKDGTGCELNLISVSGLAIGLGIGFIFVPVCSILGLNLIIKQRKLIKRRERFFRQNGGLYLKQILSRQESLAGTTTIFSAEELKKASNNYDENLIIGEGGFGTVYKGFLSDNTIVAIKKSKVVDRSQIEQFINEVVILSQINHRNVVKLLGCCLETEVPLLVYEFVSNGTLFQYLHHESTGSTVSWETRLRIAAETAEALSYLHSAASPPVIHRDIKPSNILLDASYTAKVSDFGASRLISLDQTQVATIVQGTLGYLDPEYLQTSRLTEKSDVYSFGVVLVELLTGKKALQSFKMPEEETSLTIYFLSCLKEDRLFDVLEKHITNEGNRVELKEVANLAKMCLSVKGEDRPTMKQVATELEGLRKIQKHSGVNADSKSEDTAEYLRGASSASSKYDVTNKSIAGYDSMRDDAVLGSDDGR
ncbi:putative wall-associated receptor kinase-like 16 [Alnus glutinosa]|uniref:putative wall-associated receptor kinase-like 16 n=1 Tax=Alnus glutinosa TaxID=3517 RepID=UPI002D7767B5|nr:putative wall-associated receptor kinase-like 16 [Alnus glutinosa]